MVKGHHLEPHASLRNAQLLTKQYSATYIKHVCYMHTSGKQTHGLNDFVARGTLVVAQRNRDACSTHQLRDVLPLPQPQSSKKLRTQDLHLPPRCCSYLPRGQHMRRDGQHFEGRDGVEESAKLLRRHVL